MVWSWIASFAVALAGGIVVWQHARGDRAKLRAAGLGLLAALLFAVLSAGRRMEMQKVAALVFMPLSIMWLTFGVLSLRALARGRRAVGAFFAAMFATYALGGCASVSTWLQSFLEDTLPPYVPAEAQPRFDAVLVLGGGIIRRPDTRELQLTVWGDRLLVAADLYRAGKAGVLVASGGSSDDQSEASARLWSQLGVPEGAILQIPRGRNTSEEMEEYRRLIEREGWTKVALVSSAYHLPRALRHAERLGLELTPIASHRRWPPPEDLDPYVLFPTPEVWAKTQRILWELYGMAVGR